LECDTKLGPSAKIVTIFEIPKPKDYFVGHKNIKNAKKDHFTRYRNYRLALTTYFQTITLSAIIKKPKKKKYSLS